MSAAGTEEPGPGPGPALLRLCREASTVADLVAPFAKAAVVRQLLAEMPASTDVNCYTRWRVDEVLAGASDLEVWSVLSERPRTTLWLYPSLHAKIYRSGTECLVGSANLTAAALGWSQRPNLELLIRVSADDTAIVGVMHLLRAQSVRVDGAMYAIFAAAVEKCRAETEPQPPAPECSVEAANSQADSVTDDWLPGLRGPQQLYLAYTGEWDCLTLAGRTAARRDLDHLCLPCGLSQEAFNSCVGAMLLQAPMVRAVDEFVALPRRFGEVRDMLAASLSTGGDAPDATATWQTLMRWLLFFLPRRYKRTVPGHASEVFRRLQE